MPTRIRETPIWTKIIAIEAVARNKDGEVFRVTISINGVEQTRELTLLADFPGGFEGGFNFPTVASAPNSFVAEYVFRFARGEPLSFEIDLGDLGSYAKLSKRPKLPPP